MAKIGARRRKVVQSGPKSTKIPSRIVRTQEQIARQVALLDRRLGNFARHGRIVHLQRALVAVTRQHGHVPLAIVDAHLLIRNLRLVVLHAERKLQVPIDDGQCDKVLAIVRFALVRAVPDEQAVRLDRREHDRDQNLRLGVALDDGRPIELDEAVALVLAAEVEHLVVLALVAVEVDRAVARVGGVLVLAEAAVDARVEGQAGVDHVAARWAGVAGWALGGRCFRWLCVGGGE